MAVNVSTGIRSKGKAGNFKEFLQTRLGLLDLGKRELTCDWPGKQLEGATITGISES